MIKLLIFILDKYIVLFLIYFNIIEWMSDICGSDKYVFVCLNCLWNGVWL